MEFADYDDLDVTTETFVIYSNLEIDITQFYQSIQCTPLKFPLLKSQQRMVVRTEEVINDGDIVYIEYLGNALGTKFRKEKEKQMRNCMTLIMKISPFQEKKIPAKYYNIKLSKMGNFQITGCISEIPVKNILWHLWRHLTRVPQAWHFRSEFESEGLLAYITCRMCNVKFTVPFEIDLKELNYIVKTKFTQTCEDRSEVPYSSTHEPSVGYVGVNIKILSKDELIQDVPVTVVSCAADSTLFSYSTAPFSNYLDKLPSGERDKKINKKYQNSFLVFHSGKTVMSGKMSRVNRRDSYKKFCNILHQYQGSILKEPCNK